jgi:predicted TIM-barrel fold metal-dependent hydrolase
VSTTEIPLMVSVDDHVIEPPGLFERWLPRKYADRAPRVERRTISRESKLQDGAVEDRDGLPGDVWVFGNSAYVLRRPVVVLKDVETTFELRGNEPVPYEEMRPGCYDPKERLLDMSDNHVEASLCFPQFPRFCGQVFTEQTTNDRDLGMALVTAYNDWMVEEWCGDSGGRLIPLQVVPLWDPTLAAAEVRRNAQRGVRAVTWSEIISRLGYPGLETDHWHPFFEACEETGTVICMHIGSSSTLTPIPPGTPEVAATTLTFMSSYLSIADFVFSGTLARFPRLKLAYSEGQAGWLPYAIERFDHAYTHHIWGHGEEPMPEAPSVYIRRNVFGCIYADRHAIENADKIGYDNLMYETDFPHADGSYPNTYEHLVEQFGGVDPELTYRILRGNAIKLFELDLGK